MLEPVSSRTANMKISETATSPRAILWACAAGLLLLGAAIGRADDADDQFAVAAAYYDRHEWKLAVDEFQSFLKDHAADRRAGEGRFFLAEALLQLGNFDEARRHLQQYLAAEPEGKFARSAMFRAGEAAYLSGKLADARADLETFRAKYRDDKLNAFVLPYLGEIAISGNDAAQAAALFREALQRFPAGLLQDDCRIGLAKSLEQQNQTDEAERLYASVAARAESPLADAAQFRLGTLQYAAGRYAQAIDSFSAFEGRLAKSAWQTNARLAHGWTLMKTDRTDLAIKMFEAAALDPRLRIEAHYWLALAQKANKDWAVAAKSLLLLAEANPSHELLPAMRYHAGDALLNAGDIPAAIQQFEAVMALPAGEQWLQQSARGKIQASLLAKDYAVVDRGADEFAKRFPGSEIHADVQRLAARSFVERQDWTRAAAMLEPMIAGSGRGPADCENRYLLALAYAGLKRHEEAQAVLAPVVESAEGALRTDAQLAQGSSLLALKRFAEAAIVLQAFLASKPSGDAEVKGMGELAICFARMNQIDKAKAVFAELTERHPGHPLLLPATEPLAEAAYDANDTSWSAELSARLTQGDTASPYGLKGKLGLGWSQFKAGSLREAAATFEELLKANPPEPIAAEAAFVRGRILEELDEADGALAMYQLVIDKYPKSKQYRDAMLAAARRCDRQKQFERSASLYQRLADESPQSLDADALLYEWAWVLQALGKPDEAAQKFQQLHSAYPQSPYWGDAAYRLAQRAFEAKDYNQSTTLIVELLDGKNRLPQGNGGVQIVECAAYLRGQIAAARSDWPVAREAFETFVKEYPDSPRRPTADYWIAETFYRQGDFEAASARFEQMAGQDAAKREPWMAMIPLRRAQILVQQTHYEEAYAIAEKIAVDFPDFPQQYEADYVLGRCLADRAEFDEARQAYQRVIRSSAGAKTETAAMAQWMTGESYFHQKNYEAALREYLRLEILYAYPNWQAAGLLQAGKCREMLGQAPEALKLYERLVKLYPNASFAEQARQKLQNTTAQGAIPTHDP